MVEMLNRKGREMTTRQESRVRLKTTAGFAYWEYEAFSDHLNL